MRLFGPSKALFDYYFLENNRLYVFHIDSNLTVRNR